MSPAQHSAAEHQPRPLPEGVAPYCPTCGAEEPGHYYQAEPVTA